VEIDEGAALGELKSRFFRGTKDPILIKIKGCLDAGTAPFQLYPIKHLLDERCFKIAVLAQDIDLLSLVALHLLSDYSRVCRTYNRGNLVLVDPQEHILEALKAANYIRREGDRRPWAVEVFLPRNN